MPLLFGRRSRYLEFLGDGGNLRRIMFKHMFDPASIATLRLLIALIQVGAAGLVLIAIVEIRRWLVGPIVRRFRGPARAPRDNVRSAMR